MKKNVNNLDAEDKKRKIALLESELQRLEDVKSTLNAGSIFEENDERKTMVSRMVKENNDSISTVEKELNELKGIKEEKNMVTLLRSRKATLTAKLSKIPDTKENESIRSDIKVAISQIDKYINLEKQIRSNTLSESEVRRLKQMQSTTYTTVEYVMDEVSKKR